VRVYGPHFAKVETVDGQCPDRRLANGGEASVAVDHASSEVGFCNVDVESVQRGATAGADFDVAVAQLGGQGGGDGFVFRPTLLPRSRRLTGSVWIVDLPNGGEDSVAADYASGEVGFCNVDVEDVQPPPTPLLRSRRVGAAGYGPQTCPAALATRSWRSTQSPRCRPVTWKAKAATTSHAGMESDVSRFPTLARYGHIRFESFPHSFAEIGAKRFSTTPSGRR